MKKTKLIKGKVVKGARCPKCESKDWIPTLSLGYDDDYHSTSAVCQECFVVFDIVYIADSSNIREKEAQ